MWMFDYFVQELGATIISNELVIERQGKRIFLHHGDGLGPGDGKYKVLKKFFRSGVCQWLFERLHPNFGVGLANYWSRHSRLAQKDNHQHKADEQEWLVTYCKEVLQTQTYDYMIFGHRHLPLNIEVGPKTQYINLGEWIHYHSFAVMHQGKVQLEYFERMDW